MTIISLYSHILITFHKTQYPSQPVQRAENKGNYGGLKSRYPGIHPKLICLSCKSNLFKCCSAPLRILLKRHYWDTCINSLNINHLLFTFFVSFVTGERKQHVVCVCLHVCVKVQTVPQEMKKAFSFAKQVEAWQRFIKNGTGYPGNRFQCFLQTRCSLLTSF